ncbi:MAG TPA: UDP-galactopyranose mutase [Gemmatimonadaceae bacterium]
MRCDYLIVGAGFSGLVLAERLSSQLGKRCIVVERRNHIGGNAHDEYDAAGVLVHRYGPHYFRTNAPRIADYLSQFTEWHPVSYEIRSYADGHLWHFPINLNTFEQFIGRPSTSEDFQAYLESARVPIASPRDSEEVIISQVGWPLYEKFFKGYTLKQWGRPPKELAASVCGRIPIRTNRDDRYLSEDFQALPANGYNRLFQNMLARSPGVEVLLRTDYREVATRVEHEHLIFTGAIDEFFDYRLGRLPYRSLRFEFESFEPPALAARLPYAGKPGFWQPVMQVNYPNDNAFTRIVEIKHATGQACENTTIVREYPAAYAGDMERYYPIPAPESAALYNQYAELASMTPNVSFVGRLATYRYYNMDQCVAMALAEFSRLSERSAR